MAGVVHVGWRPMRWATLLLLSVALLPFAPKSVHAQAPASSPQSASLAGKITNLHSKPLEGMRLTLRSTLTGFELHTTSGKGGLYLFASIPPGRYLLLADEQELGHGSLDELEILPAAELHMQLALDLYPFSSTNSDQQLARLAAPNTTPPALEHPALSAHLHLNALEKISLNGKIISAPQSDSGAPKQEAGVLPAQISAPGKVLQRESSVLRPSYSQPVNYTLLAQTSLLAALAERSGQLLQAALPAGKVARKGTLAATRRHSFALPEAADPASEASRNQLDHAILAATPSRDARWQSFLESTPSSGSGGSTSTEQPLGPATLLSPTVLLDGAPLSTAFGNSLPSSSDDLHTEEATATAWNNHASPALSQGALRSITTTATNTEARSSHAAGGEIAAESQSGGEQLHGQLFFFARQSALGARNPFTRWL